MTTLVFCGQANIEGYIQDPPLTFRMSVPIRIFESEGMTATSQDLDVDIANGVPPESIYQGIYERILEICVTRGFDPPAKSDIFGYLPITFTILLP